MSEQESQSDFRTVSYFILESLKTRGRNVEALQKSLTSLEIVIVSKTDLKELRDHYEERLTDQAERIATLEKDVSVLNVKAGTIAAIVGAGASFLIKTLGG